MKQQIVSRYDNDKVLYECDVDDGITSATAVRHAVVRAISEGANLSDADLRGADLSDADLSGANLSGADLRGADLRGTDLESWQISNATLPSGNLYLHTPIYVPAELLKQPSKEVAP